MLAALLLSSSLALLGCNSNLDPISLRINALGYVVVTVKNQSSETPAILSNGTLAVYVDGVLDREYALANFSDQSFVEPKGQSDLVTDTRITGENRRVLVRIDPHESVNDHNRFQNTLSRNFDAPTRAGADLVVTMFRRNTSGTLSLTIANRGSKPLASGVIQYDISVNGVHHPSVTKPFTSLAARTMRAISFPSIVLDQNARVFARVRLNDRASEIDTTNNQLLRNMSADPLAPYRALLSDGRIGPYVTWRLRSGNAVPYTSWTSQQKSDLFAAIERRERGEPQPMQVAPTPVITRWWGDIAASDAWKIYVEHLAQSLWLEVNHKVPWKLIDQPANYRINILSDHSWAGFNKGANTFTFGTTFSWNPQVDFLFAESMGLIRGSQEETIYALTDWMRGRLRHIGSFDNHAIVYGTAGPVPTERILYPKETTTHYTPGCAGTTSLFSALLRALNIPVLNGDVALSTGIHSRPIFPSIGKTLAHSDDVHSDVFIPSGEGNIVPTEEVFYTSEDFDRMFQNPITFNCDGSGCLSTGMQASYNLQRARLLKAYQYASDYLLRQYVWGGEAYLDGLLRGDEATYKQPLLTPAERTQVKQNLAGYLANEGPDRIALIRALILDRWNAFVAGVFLGSEGANGY